MAISAEQLNVILSARDREFTRAMDRAQRRVERFSQQSNRSLMSARGSFTALAGAARTFLPALSAGLVIQQVRRVVSELDEIGKKADAIGLTTDALQELRTVAEEAGVSQEALDNSMMQFSRRLGEARQGLGQARYALDDLNLSADDLAQMPLDQALQTVAEEMTKVEDATARTALAQQLFGRSGVPMLNLLREGAAGMEAMRQNARDLGIVIDEDLIRKAEETENKLGLLSRVINADLSEALMNLAPLLVATANGIAAIARTINYLFSSMPIEEEMTTRLQRIDRNMGQIDALITEFGSRREDIFPTDEFTAFDSALGSIPRNGEEALNQLAELQAEANGIRLALAQLGQTDVPPALEPTTLASISGGVAQVTDEYEKLLQEIIEGNDLLKDLGVTTDILRSTFETMETQMEAAFMGMIDGTMSAKDAFRSMAADIIRQLYRVLVVQRMVGSVEAGTGIAGAVGRLFGAASGRPVQAGQPVVTGEHGRELFVPSSAGRILSVAQSKDAVNGGGGSVNVYQTINVSTGVQQTVRTEIKQLMPQIAESAKSAVVDAKRRGGSYGRAFS
jgi:hypothetical protein